MLGRLLLAALFQLCILNAHSSVAADASDFTIGQKLDDLCTALKDEPLRVGLVRKMFQIVDEAENQEPLDSVRLKRLARFELAEPLVWLFFATGNHDALRLLSWVLERNPSVRHWLVHDQKNKNCLQSSASFYLSDVAMEIETRVCREAQFALALLASLLFDPLGWPPDSHDQTLPKTHRYQLAAETIARTQKPLIAMKKQFVLARRFMPEFLPLERKLLLDHRLDDVYSLFRLFERMRALIIADPFYRRVIASPGPGVKNEICERIFGSWPLCTHCLQRHRFKISSPDSKSDRDQTAP